MRVPPTPPSCCFAHHQVLALIPCAKPARRYTPCLPPSPQEQGKRKRTAYLTVTTYFHSRVTGHNHVASCSCQVGWEAQPLAGPLRVCPELGVGVAEVVGGAHY